MNKFMGFVRRERIYLFLLIFILTLNLAVALAGGEKWKAKEKPGYSAEELFIREAEMGKLLASNRPLAFVLSLSSLLVFAVILLGMLIDAALVSFKLAKRKFDIATLKPAPVRWNLVDVGRVAILFLFFGYMLVIIESLLIGELPILKNDNFRMMLNSSILDTLAVVFIIYFTVGQYKEKLVALGISLKNFFKNVFYGIIGYIAAVPVLVAALFIVVALINLTKYVPEKQAVVELFMKEDNAPFLIYTGIFAAFAGPIVEELFFRGFMYGAFKKSIGIFWAAILTSTLFAALHTHIVGFLPILILGMLLAYLYEKTGTLVSSITVHTIHNLSMVFFVFLLKQIKA